MREEFEIYIKNQRYRIDKALRQVLHSIQQKTPEILHQAMSYSLLAPGKRLRPIVSITICESLHGTSVGLDPVLCALEMVHTYSLIQDDLPCMDDDDMRRGKPSCHKVFGEGIALLASDALLTEAFGLITETSLTPEQKVLMVQEMVTALGCSEMIAGQALDITYQETDVDSIYSIHRQKTGALFCAAARMGALFTRTSSENVALATEYGKKFGLAFQIVDDMIDEKQDESEKNVMDQQKRRRPSLTSFLPRVDLERQVMLLIEHMKLIAQKMRINSRKLDLLAESIWPEK